MNLLYVKKSFLTYVLKEKHKKCNEGIIGIKNIYKWNKKDKKLFKDLLFKHKLELWMLKMKLLQKAMKFKIYKLKVKFMNKRFHKFNQKYL